MLVLTMVISIISPGSTLIAHATEDYDGYVYVTVEKLTLGQGFAQEPVKVGYYENENLTAVLARGLGENLVTSAGTYGTSIDGYKDGGEPDGWTSEMIPALILEKLEEGACTISARANAEVLSNYDYTGQSYFMVCVDNVAPGFGVDGIVYSDTATNDTFENGSVIRLQFGIYNYGSDLNTSWSTPLVTFPDKDGLIKEVAEYSGARTDAAYIEAIDVLEDWDATQDEVSNAKSSLETAEQNSQKIAALSDSYKDKLDAAVAYVKNNAAEPVLGSEWSVLSVARNGVKDVEWYHTYLDSVEETMKEKGTNKIKENQSTDNSRVIIGLSAIGADPADVAGYNLIEPLADMDYVTKQGINGSVYALIALDCNQYEIPTVAEGATQTTRDALVQKILDSALENGGWAYSGTTADPDMTAMAIQALAPYYEKETVKTVVDKALTALSEMQDENGCYASWGSTNSMSCAQVVCALTALNIDLEADERFVKNGKSVLDGMLSFYDESAGGFFYTAGGKVNTAATIQAAYALVAYSRWKDGKNSLYNMTDAVELYVCEEGSHAGGEATCVKKAVCEICGTEYGALNAANHENTEVRNAKESTCSAEGYTGDTYCLDCNKKIADGKTIEKKAHTVVTDPAVAPTETTAGKTEGSHCFVCNQVIVAQTEVPATGTNTTNPGGTTDTSVTTEEAKNTVKTPAKTSFKNVTSSKKGQLKLTWKKKSGVSGYEIQVSTSSKYKTKATKKYTVKNDKTTSKTIKKLKSGKKYYVRIRTYVTKDVNGSKVTKYSKWTKKSVRVK